MQYIAKLRTICFEVAELEKLFSKQKKLEIVDKINASGLTAEEMFNDDEIMKEVVRPISYDTANHRDEHEIFIALELLKFFKSGSQVCFELIRSFDPKKNPIATLENLNTFREGQSSTDFAIKSDEELRLFQLTRHRGKYATNDIFETIENKLTKLNGENLLVILQSKTDVNIFEGIFKEIHENLMTRALKMKEQIIIAVNDNNRTTLYEVYPGLSKISRA